MALPACEAFLMVFRMALCAIIAFPGAWAIVAALLDRKISGREAVVFGVGLLVVMAWAMALAMRGWLGVALMAGVIGGVWGAVRTLAAASDRLLGRDIQDEDIGRYQAALEFDPNNVAAHSLLAETYRRAGKLELALQEYEAALRLDPSLVKERYWVGRLQAEIEAGRRSEVLCPRCGAPRPPGAVVCPECGRPYSSLELWAHALRRMEPARKAALLLAGAGGLVAIGAVAMMSPAFAKVLAVLVFFGAPLALLIVSIRSRRQMG